MLYSTRYCITYLVLHPQHKLEYFRQAGWEDEWIDTAETIVRDEFAKSYSSFNTSGGGDIKDNLDDAGSDSDSDSSDDPVVELEVKEKVSQPCSPSISSFSSSSPGFRSLRISSTTCRHSRSAQTL